MARAPESSRAGTTRRGDSPSDEAVVGPVGETLRRARQHRGWSLREVERRIGRPNAYLSQVERGVIRQPDPALIWELAQLYHLDFTLLAQWLGISRESRDSATSDVTQEIIRLVLNLTGEQKLQALDLLQRLDRDDRT